MISQFVDTFAVITITHFYAKGLPVDEAKPIWPQLWTFIGSGYVFKVSVAVVDTVPFYIGVKILSRYLVKKGALLPLLHFVQEKKGWISADDMVGRPRALVGGGAEMDTARDTWSALLIEICVEYGNKEASKGVLDPCYVHHFPGAWRQ